MRNLYLRIFFSFWTAMVLVLAFTVMATLWLADERGQREQQHQDQLAQQASDVFATGGVQGLHEWLQRQSTLVAPDRLFVLDRHGDDLLGQRVPQFLRSAGQHRSQDGPAAGGGSRGGAIQGGGSQGAAQDKHDLRLLSQLVTPSNETYALALLGQPRGPLGIFGSTETVVVAALTTLLISAGVCFLLARHLSDPIRHLRAATRSIADGDLGARVAGLMGRRRDELALLAVDFDAMAERLRNLLESQQQLLRDVSHELRSPLARLQIALGLARRPHANLEQEFDRIEQETQRLDELIGEILSLSRLDDPARELPSETVNLEDLLETLVDNARVEAEPHWVRVDLEVTADLGVEGDRELLFRALENIVRNAVRFSPKGGTVRLHGWASGDEVLIEITDQGPGVPTELLERIFEPFFRVGKARDRDSGGYGIGLAITARVIKLHGGQVRAYNDGGLRVEVRLPRHPIRSPRRRTAPPTAVAA
jgi:two-component system sensor histidine kinase CpxA